MLDRYFTIVNVLLITAFIGLCTGTFYKAVTSFMDRTAPVPLRSVGSDVPQADELKPKALGDYDQVASRNLFMVGSMASKGSDGMLSLDDLEKTDLQLTLWGTIAGGGDMAWAIIEDKSTRSQGLYKVGDKVQNATLTHVFRNKVVLSVNGKDQILETMDGEGGADGGPGMAGPMGPAGTGSGSITVERNLINESIKDLNTLMKDVRIRPHFSNGQSDGLIISGIRGDSVFKKLGLRNGDIILGVDGSKIQSVDDAMKLYAGLKNMQNMKIEIKRRGQVQTLDYNVK